jgi:hypothetical protein
VLKFVGIPLRQIAGLVRGSPRSLATSLRAQCGTLERKRQLLDRAIVAIKDLETVVATGVVAAPHLFKRIIEVIHMQDDVNALKQQYDELVYKKIERLRALPAEVLADLRAQWSALVSEIREVLAEDPAGPKAQALSVPWTGLLSRLMGQRVDPGTLTEHQRSREWDPKMASFVDKPVWDFMTRVLAARR